MSQPDREKPFGLPLKEGRCTFSARDWDIVKDFIKSRKWMLDSPAIESDLHDSLLSSVPPYGAFMMGFDFHLSPDGPKLIEINTNAGGLATVFAFTKFDQAKAAVRREFVQALKTEFSLGRPGAQFTSMAIVDDKVKSQGLYPEMLYFADLMIQSGVQAFVLSPEDLVFNGDGLYYEGVRIELIYNRMTDFRLEAPEHAHVRNAVLADQALITPHPAVYVRSADKRNLPRINHPVIPKTYLLKDKSIEDWQQIKKDFVFKPPAGNASKGVYRGDKISVAKLKTLSPDTIVQEFVAPPVADDESKFDVRVFTRDTDIIGIASRHFTGQVMEMSSAKSGFREALPDGVCCLPCLEPVKCAEMLRIWAEQIQKENNLKEAAARAVDKADVAKTEPVSSASHCTSCANCPPGDCHCSGCAH